MPSAVALSGSDYIILPKGEYDRLARRAAVIEAADLPALPRKLTDGNYPAIEAGRVVLARKLAKRRWAAAFPPVTREQATAVLEMSRPKLLDEALHAG